MISRRQVLAAGEAEHDIRRRVRRREWTRVHPGVYVDHTGTLTWKQRAWAAVAYAWPAVLCHDSALLAADPRHRGDDGRPIHVAVARDRVVRAVPGIVVHRLVGLDTRAAWHVSPPRVRVEHAALDVAVEARDELTTIATLADLVGAGRTTSERLLTALSTRRRIARRPFLLAVLGDVDAGTCSVLEHDCLTLVERPHGLPVAGRQVRDSLRGTVFRDVEYDVWRLIVELDGRLFHTAARDRDADLERDLDAVVDGRDTVRLGWGQVHLRPCATAARIATLLRRRGWTGTLTPCPACATGERVVPRSPGDAESPRSA